MKHQPKTDQEIAELGLLAPGVYDFEVTAAEDKISSKGNEMLEIKLSVFDTTGAARPMRDWIMPQMAKKFKHFHNATGMMDKYEAGSLEAADVIGKTGKCMVISAPYTNKDGLEVQSNKIDDYVKQENYVPAPVHKDVESDEIPFVWLIPAMISASMLLNNLPFIYG